LYAFYVRAAHNHMQVEPQSPEDENACHQQAAKVRKEKEEEHTSVQTPPPHSVQRTMFTSGPRPLDEKPLHSVQKFSLL
jgi:hypothetical protein